MQTRKKPLTDKSNVSSVHFTRRLCRQQLKKSTKFLRLVVPEPRNSRSAAAMLRIRMRITEPFLHHHYSQHLLQWSWLLLHQLSTRIAFKSRNPTRFYIPEQIHLTKNHLDKLHYTALSCKPPSLFFLAKDWGWSLDNTLRMSTEDEWRWNSVGNSGNQFWSGRGIWFRMLLRY
jgi:hypothetical protein